MHYMYIYVCINHTFTHDDEPPNDLRVSDTFYSIYAQHLGASQRLSGYK